VAKSDPDGYTLLSGSTTLPISASLFAKLTYDPMKDFKPITLVGQQPMLLVVNSKFEAQSVQDLIALAKKEQGRLAYASAGYGSVNHLAMELFLLQANITMTHITYKGNSAAALDVISGQVPVFVDFPLTGLPHIKDGKLRALATTNVSRLKQLPDLPTVAESGLPGYQASLWFAFFAPVGVPDAIIEKLNAAALTALSNSTVRTRLEELGVEVIALGPDQLSKVMNEDYGRWKTVIEKAKIKVE
jgi:tripartite-type tricarboxylate transporter receptor subunit TctC